MSKHQAKGFFILCLAFMSISVIAGPNNPSQSGSGTTETVYLSRTECNLLYSQVSATQIQFQSCSSPQITSSNWQLCFKGCCSDQVSEYSQFNIPSVSALEYCQEANKAESSFGMLKTMIFMMVGCIPLMGGIVLILWCRKRDVLPRISWERELSKPEQIDEEIKEVQWKDEKQINFQVKNEIIWSPKAIKENQINPQQTCSICLHSNSSAKLFCGHSYHPNCLGLWFKYGKTCTCCHDENIRGVKVYCQRCHWNYFVCTRTALASHQLSQGYPKRCGGCRQNINANFSLSLQELVSPVNNNKKEQVVVRVEL